MKNATKTIQYKVFIRKPGNAGFFHPFPNQNVKDARTLRDSARARGYESDVYRRTEIVQLTKIK